MSERPHRTAGRDIRAFSRLLPVDDIPTDGLEMTIDATPEECAAVAVELDLPAVLGLAADVQVSRLPGGRFHVGGEVRGRVTQVCVVTLEPFDSDVVQEIDIDFAPAPRSGPAPEAARSRRTRQPEVPAEPRGHAASEADVDAPDPLVDGRIDLGAVAEEFLTLALDFYPRKPGVAFADVVGGAEAHEPSAFAALARFKDRS